MNSNYNYSDFTGMRLTANNELQRYETRRYESRRDQEQLQLQPVATPAKHADDEKRIEAMLLSHSKYHIYCE